MKLAQILSSILWPGLLLSMGAVPALSDPTVSILTVTERDITPPSPPVQSLLTIAGRGFKPGGRILFGFTDITGFCLLNASHNVYVCTLTPVIPPGEYRLAYGFGSQIFDDFDVVVPTPIPDITCPLGVMGYTNTPAPHFVCIPGGGGG